MERHRPIAAVFALGLCVIAASGCRLCADCDLDAYPSYGGAWQRTMRDSGRVGSLFDPGGSRSADLSARVDAETMEQENRRQNSDDANQAKKDDADANERSTDGENGGDIRDRNFDNDEQLKDMENRLRDLDLQDIDYRSPETEAQDWR
jgi:hypothetical protein